MWALGRLWGSVHVQTRGHGWTLLRQGLWLFDSAHVSPTGQETLVIILSRPLIPHENYWGYRCTWVLEIQTQVQTLVKKAFYLLSLLLGPDQRNMNQFPKHSTLISYIHICMNSYTYTYKHRYVYYEIHIIYIYKYILFKDFLHVNPHVCMSRHTCLWIQTPMHICKHTQSLST